jgi:spore maturation protein CgeB
MDRVQEYYAGASFRERLGKIAQGEIQPRILIATCRWTTFLKHCASDFEKAFAQAGCETCYLIEENDVQTLSPALHWSEVDRFQPDVLFSVSHARPTTPYLPRELPHIAYIQDKCGPILWHPTLEEHISSQDLFVCSLSEFQKYLLSKKVPGHQTFVMPVPTDETIFYPLDPDDPSAQQYSGNVSYIKHGNADTETAMREWMRPKGFLASPDEITRSLAEFFQDMFRQFQENPEQLWYEEDMQASAREKLSKTIAPEMWPDVQQLVTTFSVEVYPTCRRRYYLRVLSESGISLRMYGKGWERDPEFSTYATGSVERGPQLNAVYNFSRINLHLHPYSTMHQRLSECGLSGGFMMIADHAPEKDWESARTYFAEDKEVVFFQTAEELVERCRYYLAHPEERREIAQNMYRRAVRERTCKAGAETVLAKWRELLRQNND